LWIDLEGDVPVTDRIKRRKNFTKKDFRMKKRSYVLTLTAIFVGAALFPSNTYQTLSVDGMPVEFVFRSLQPGEVILAVLKKEPPAKAVRIQFLDKKYVLSASRPDEKPFALIGIDLGVKPRSYTLRITAEKADGTKEDARREFLVEAKSFSQKRFWVKESLIVPPPQEQERIRREQELLQDIYNCITPEWLGSGSFIPPLDQEPFPNFGQRRIYNNRSPSLHAGVDIGAPWGTPIRAANSGKVVLASSLYFSGKTVIIEHGQGVFSIYGHMSNLLVKRGDAVKKGALIGKVGSTGRSTGPHLHWALKIYESRVDPFALVGMPLD
jgi:murein DD-endopeptidase MepM/ murein hydrolase activator NlpD